MSRIARGFLRGFMVLAVGMAAASAAPAAETGDLRALRALALELVNEARAEHDVPPLRADRRLGEAAQAHAGDMLERAYFAHESPEGETVLDRFLAAGGVYHGAIGENIARCPDCPPPPAPEHVEDFQQGWMESPEHRENILDPGFDRFGFGIVAGRDGDIRAVQTFAGPGLPRGTAARGEATPMDGEALESLLIDLVNADRQAHDLPPMQRSGALSDAAGALLGRVPAGELPQLDQGTAILDALPADSRGEWRSVAVAAGQCTGCGREPTDADARFFHEQWMGSEGQRSSLLRPETTRLGFAIAADGEGRKAALAVLGTPR